MPIDLARTPAFGARTFVAPLLAALLALGFARRPTISWKAAAAT